MHCFLSDKELPSFTNCPSEPIIIQLFGTAGSIMEQPLVEDNSNFTILTWEPRWFAFDLKLLQPVEVNFTVQDANQNAVSCVVKIDVYG